jgi:hypothetical protein
MQIDQSSVRSEAAGPAASSTERVGELSFTRLNMGVWSCVLVDTVSDSPTVIGARSGN